MEVTIKQSNNDSKNIENTKKFSLDCLVSHIAIQENQEDAFPISPRALTEIKKTGYKFIKGSPKLGEKINHY